MSYVDITTYEATAPRDQSRFAPVPRFDAIDIANCETRDGLTLLYAGISPKKPPTNGRAPSKEALRSRIYTHYTGNAEGSTLRLTLGCLLAERLDLELRRYGSGTRMHFGIG